MYKTATLVAILLLATLLRFYRLDASSLWSDEGNTWALLNRSFTRIAQDAAADIHPPGYYWLLKLWSTVFGADINGMRSFSVVAGVALVYVIYRIGKYMEFGARSWPVSSLLAAFLAALNPFQVYYSQEARMYMLLALASAGLFWAMLALVDAEKRGGRWLPPAIGYILFSSIGLWTHYTFPVILASAALAYMGLWAKPSFPRPLALLSRQRLLRFVAINFVTILIFAPWLPIAVERVLNWPKGGEEISVFHGLRLTIQTLTFGPMRELPGILWPWLLVAGMLPILGLLALRRRSAALPLALWLFVLIGLMFGLGLFSEAFLKFLLTASPAWCLLAASAPLGLRIAIPLQAGLALGGAALAAFTLPAYYTNPNARDNYAAVARYVHAMGNPATDLVVLDAPGQQEVWRYYDPGFPVLPLPHQRPPEPQQTMESLSAAISGRRQVFALFWATDEADPEDVVERWLDQHAFKGLESWQGNLRFVVYSAPGRLICTSLQPEAVLDGRVVLQELCQPAFPQQIASGEAALVGLRWRPLTSIEPHYKVSVQLLDSRNQVIAQHDGEPAGGSQPTDAWQPGAAVNDNHGLAIPVGTPPGEYRLIAAMYDPTTGQRLPTTDGDAIPLGVISIQRPVRAVPPEVIPMPNRVHVKLGPIILIGYGAHRKGYAHAPDTPIHPGDLAHFTFFWQGPNPLPADWPDDQLFTLRLGQQELTAPLAGGNYPTQAWQAGEIVRGEFDILFDGQSRRPNLQIGAQEYKLKNLPR